MQKGKSQKAGEPQHWGGIKIQREKKSKSSGERHTEKQERTKERKRSQRLCDSSAAEQQVTERRKSRVELIFVKEVNMIVESTLFKHSGSCRGAGQVADRQSVTWRSTRS